MNSGYDGGMKIVGAPCLPDSFYEDMKQNLPGDDNDPV